MDQYTIAKCLHLLGVVMMVGATLINGMLHARAKRGPSPTTAALLGAVVQINRVIMLPGFVVLPVTGLWLAVTAGYDWNDMWLLLGITLTAVLIIGFVLGARIENQLHDIAKGGQGPLPDAYFIEFKRAVPIGALALILSLVTIWVMVAKPVLGN